MSQIDRQALAMLATNLGAARAAIVTRLGDMDRNPGGLLDLEAALCRLRGSTLFHDTDTARAFIPFGNNDLVGLGLQGARLGARTVTSIPPRIYGMGDHWNPSFYGPPCPEGFGIWSYNSWKGYVTNPLTAQSEGGLESARLIQGTPQRYTGSGYANVPFFERARYISFYNNGIIQSGSYALSAIRVTVTLSSEDLEGCRVRDNSGKPLDLQVWYHPQLVQGTGNPIVNNTWDDIGVTSLMSASARQLKLCNFTVQASMTAGAWDVIIEVPSDLAPYSHASGTWPSQWWWHTILYWGSQDMLPTASAANLSRTDLGAASQKWARKNFFDNTLSTQLYWNQAGLFINDPTPYLIANHRTHFKFYDGQFSQPIAPERYPLITSWPAASVDGVPNSITNYTSLPIGAACAVLAVVTTSGDSYSGAQTAPQLVFGPPITPEFWPAQWQDCAYFPPLPQDTVEIARMVLVRAPGTTFDCIEAQYNSGSAEYNTNYIEDRFASEQDTLSSVSIAWMQQSISTHATPPPGDPLLAKYLLSNLQSVTSKLRSVSLDLPVINTAFATLVPGARVPAILAPTSASLLSATGRGSSTFRGLLKNPLDPALQPGDGSNPAFVFDINTSGMINELAGAPPSTELMRLDADHLYLTGNRLPSAWNLEFYLNQSSQCSAVDPNGAGTRLGRDYTFRLVLEDADQNTLFKDVNIMASQYYLTPEEYQRLVKAGEATAGYYTSATLNDIAAWRLYGYAGLIPDMQMGQARPLQMRVVSPADNSQITYAQFVQNLINQGDTQAQIDAAVQDFLDSGGEFYVVDLNAYSNKFVAVRSVSLSTATFSTLSVPYYQDNTQIEAYFNIISAGSLTSLTSLRADQFTVAAEGLNAGDLERYGNQAPTAGGQVETGNNLGFDQPDMAFKIVPDGSKTEFGIHLRFIPSVSNTTNLPLNPGFLQSSLYTDAGGVPGKLLSTGSSISYASLSNTYGEYRFQIQGDFTAGITYWLRVSKSAQEIGGEIQLETGSVGSGPTLLLEGQIAERLLVNALSPQAVFTVSVNVRLQLDSGNLTGALLNSGNVVALLCLDNGGAPGLPIGGVNASQPWSGLSVIAQPITFTLTNSYDPTLTYWVVFVNSALPQGGSVVVDISALNYNSTQFRVNAAAGPGEVWQGSPLTPPWLALYSPNPAVLGVFRRDSGNVTQTLPPPNIARTTDSFYKLEGWTSFTCAPLDTPSILSVYPRAVYDAGTSAWHYVRFSRDIWIVARFLVGGSLQETIISIPGYNSVTNTGEPSPVQLWPDPIDALVYLGVGKQRSDLTTPTNGAPPGDQIVLRSS